MGILAYIFCVLNVFLALISIFPCIMGAAMGADSGFGLWPWIEAISVIGFMWFNDTN